MISLHLNKYNFIDQMKEDEMDKAYGRYGGKKKCVLGLVGNPEQTTWKTYAYRGNMRILRHRMD